MALAGVHHIGILVSDLTQAERLATEVLGLEVSRRVSLPEESTEIEHVGIVWQLIEDAGQVAEARR